MSGIVHYLSCGGGCRPDACTTAALGGLQHLQPPRQVEQAVEGGGPLFQQLVRALQ